MKNIKLKIWLAFKNVSRATSQYSLPGLGIGIIIAFLIRE